MGLECFKGSFGECMRLSEGPPGNPKFKECVTPLDKNEEDIEFFKIADEDREKLEKVNPDYFPSLYINNKLYKGPFGTAYIIQNICSSLKTPPEICLENDRTLPFEKPGLRTRRFFYNVIALGLILFIIAVLSAALQYIIGKIRHNNLVKAKIDDYYKNGSKGSKNYGERRQNTKIDLEEVE